MKMTPFKQLKKVCNLSKIVLLIGSFLTPFVEVKLNLYS